MTDIAKVGVVGAGLMGHGIAQVSAEAGYDVVLLDADAAALERGLDVVRGQVAKAVEKGRRTQEEADDILGRLRGATTVGELQDRDIVIEAIVENLEAKNELWRELDAAVQPSCVFATNTSSLPVIDQAAVTSRPDRFIGLHFFNPVQMMKLVEVVRTIAASDEAVQPPASPTASGSARSPSRPVTVRASWSTASSSRSCSTRFARSRRASARSRRSTPASGSARGIRWVR